MFKMKGYSILTCHGGLANSALSTGHDNNVFDSGNGGLLWQPLHHPGTLQLLTQPCLILLNCLLVTIVMDPRVAGWRKTLSNPPIDQQLCPAKSPEMF